MTTQKKCRWIKHHSLCCQLICSVFTLKMEFCLPSRKGGERRVVPGGEEHTRYNRNSACFMARHSFFFLPKYTSNESRLAWKWEVKKAEMTTKLLLCTLFIQVLIIYTLIEQFEAAVKKSLLKGAEGKSSYQKTQLKTSRPITLI